MVRIFDAGLVVTPDASLIGSDEELEEMATVYLPDSSSVALAIGWATSLPLVGNASGNEDAVFVLNDDGEIHVFAREGSGVLPWSLLPWPAGYEYSGTLSPPALPSGTTVRHYCDIEVLFDGDIVVTFAQDPTISLLGNPYLTEGYMRYDHTTSAWEPQVTNIAGFNLAHPVKFGGFTRQSCLSVDYNRNLSLIGFASSNSSLAPIEATRAWRVTNTGSGVFPFYDVATVPSGAGYGRLEDVALLDDDFLLVLHDNTSNDVVELVEVGTNTVVSFASITKDLNAIAVSEVNDGHPLCEKWIVFASVQTANSYPTGDECSTFMSRTLVRCP
jgi:hypothetical protein